MLARGVLFEDGVDLSQIATTLLLAIHSLLSVSGTHRSRARGLPLRDLLRHQEPRNDRPLNARTARAETHSSLINRLPAALRCYVGCAAKLYGDVDAADLVKIHIRSGKLTLLFYNNFDSSPLPKLRERIKINMRSQKIDFFDYSRDDEEQLLFMKSRYMAPDQEGYERQKTFDEALEKLHLLDFDLSQFGPPTSVFTAALASAGYSINGFTIAALSE